MKNTNRNEKRIKSATVKEILLYIKPYTFSIVCSLLLAFISALTALYIPILVGNAIDCIIDKGNVEFDALKPILIKIAVLAGISALSAWIQSIFNNKITFKVVRDLRRDAFDKIHSLPISYLDTHKSGDIVSRIIGDADSFADGLLMGFTQLFTGVVTIIGTVVFMLTIKPSITLVVVFVTPLSLIAASVIAKRTYSMFKEQAGARAEQAVLINEAVGNQKVIKAFNREEKTQNEFDRVNEKLRKCSLKAVFWSSLTNPCTRFVNALVYASVGLFGAFSVISGGGAAGALTVGGLSSFLGYANSYTKPFNEISGVVAELQNSLACAGRILEFIKQNGEADDSACGGEMRENEFKRSRCVEFENVSFSYDKSRKLIKNVNIKAENGARVAIVGPTGCGKTTLINLLMRFYSPDEGRILIGDIPSENITRKALRGSFGMVLQETWLKTGTIRENIKLARPKATDEEMIDAAKASYAHGFIKRLKNGYDTVIGEEGGELSQGEKQLLCIARVMLSSPAMLILDEATSSIDTRTEHKIQKAFETLMKGKTSFIVAHRLSTIKNADLILVMKDGNIMEQGTHDSLIEKGGFYKTLYYSQFVGTNE